MHSWLFTPFPVPFPAPSFVGLFTANALVLVLLLVLGYRYPMLRRIFGPPPFSGLLSRRWFWTALLVCIACFGLVELHFWGEALDLIIGLVWSVIYNGVLIGISLILMHVVKKQPVHALRQRQ